MPLVLSPYKLRFGTQVPVGKTQALHGSKAIQYQVKGHDKGNVKYH